MVLVAAASIASGGFGTSTTSSLALAFSTTASPPILALTLTPKTRTDLSSTRAAAICQDDHPPHPKNHERLNFLSILKERFKGRQQQRQAPESKEEEEEEEQFKNNRRTRTRRRRRRTRARTTSSSLDDYEKRKREWAAQHTSVDALRKRFGENRNQVWGDLDATTSRRLYKTLLPKALLELYRVGLRPQDLAPLAYQARLAAKLYARERCVVPARWAAQGYDGFRQWQRYGAFQCQGMTYDQVWHKYYQQAILHEADQPTSTTTTTTIATAEPTHSEKKNNKNVDLAEEDVTARTCLKILERSCATNERIDQWVLGSVGGMTSKDAAAMEEQQEQELLDLATITQQLEQDVFDVLEGHKRDHTAKRTGTLRLLARAKRRFQKRKDNHNNNNSNKVAP